MIFCLFGYESAKYDQNIQIQTGQLGRPFIPKKVEPKPKPGPKRPAGKAKAKATPKAAPKAAPVTPASKRRRT